MKFTVLGSGTGVPSTTRGAAGYLLETASSTMLFDCGMGTVQRLLAVGVDPVSITHLFISHQHPDHCADTVALLFAKALVPERRPAEALRLYGPSGTRAWLGSLRQSFPGLEIGSTQVHEGMVLKVQGDGWQVQSGPVIHGDIRAMGFRITVGDRTLVYTGDTSECSEVVTLAREANVLVSECSYPDGRMTRWHLSPSQVGRLATRAGVGAVVLSHLYPPCELVDVAAQCSGSYEGPVTVARDLMGIDSF